MNTQKNGLQKNTFRDSFSLWYHAFSDDNQPKKGQKSSDYEEALKKIFTFSDVKSFWNIYQHLTKPSDLQNGIEYEIFKKDIKPIWEDESNVKGGKFSLLISKDYASLFWEEMALAFCGGVIPFYDSITGICMSSKKTYDVAQIWFDHYDRNVCSEMREELKKFFMIPHQVNLKLKTFLKIYEIEDKENLSSGKKTQTKSFRKGKF
ncbi:MAG: eukaryotic translation initiation factor EIF4E family protein [archaeon]|nr:eukaryotic translation initiation factor EIF4E family protein [archaeon]